VAMFSMKFDAKADATLEELQRKLGASSKAEVLRTAVALLKVAQEGRDRGMKIALANSNDVVQKEIVLPG
jgi:hypothetical protein